MTKWSNDLCLHFLLSSVFPHIYGKYCKCSTRYFAVSGIRVLHLIFDTLDGVRGVVEEVLNTNLACKCKKTIIELSNFKTICWLLGQRLGLCCSGLPFKIGIPLFIPRHTIVAGYYGFTLDVRVSVRLSVRPVFVSG